MLQEVRVDKKESSTYNFGPLDLLQELGDDVQSATSGLSVNDSTAAEFVAKLRHLKSVEECKEAVLSRLSEIKDLYSLIDQYGLEVPELDRATFLNLQTECEALDDAIQTVLNARDCRTEHYQRQLEAGLLSFKTPMSPKRPPIDIQVINASCVELQVAAEDETMLSAECEYEDVADELKGLKRRLDDARCRAQEIVEIQEYLELPRMSMEHIESADREVQSRLDLWNGTKEFEEEAVCLRQQAFLEVNLSQLEESLAARSKAVAKMDRCLPENSHLPELKTQIEKFKKLLPVLKSLQNPALKNRHWEKIDATVGERSLREKGIQLEELVNMGILRWTDCLSAISVEASQEAALEQSLQKISEKWEQTDFTLTNYKETKDTYILTSVEDITTLLEDSLLTMSTISASRSIGQRE